MWELVNATRVLLSVDGGPPLSSDLVSLSSPGFVDRSDIQNPKI